MVCAPAHCGEHRVLRRRLRAPARPHARPLGTARRGGSLRQSRRGRVPVAGSDARRVDAAALSPPDRPAPRELREVRGNIRPRRELARGVVCRYARRAGGYCAGMADLDGAARAGARRAAVRHLRQRTAAGAAELVVRHPHTMDAQQRPGVDAHASAWRISPRRRRRRSARCRGIPERLDVRVRRGVGSVRCLRLAHLLVLRLETGDLPMRRLSSRFTASLAAVILAQGAAGAQQPTTFVMLKGSDTLAVERVTRTANRLDGDFVSPAGGVRVRYAATLVADGTMPKLETWAYRGANDTTGTHTTMQLEGDSMAVDLPGRTMRFPTKPGAIVYFNPSMGLLEQAVIRAHSIGGQSAEVPLFVSEGAATVPLSVTWVGSDSAHVSLGGVIMNVALGVDGRITGIAVPSQDVRVVRVDGTRVSATIAKPDYSAASDAPYTAEEVTVRTPAGLKLTGTLTLPKTRPVRGAPAIVTITGSGTEERDESLPGVKGYRPFRQIADTLGRRGIAVLRLDDRGAGGSDAGPHGATSADFADDVRAGLAYLRTRRDIDGDRLALVGHSEGGMIAPMVAATDPKLRAIVLMAARRTPAARFAHTSKSKRPTRSCISPARSAIQPFASWRTSSIPAPSADRG